MIRIGQLKIPADMPEARIREELEQLFPGKFLLCSNRDTFDYVYDINDLADLRGRKFQSKRNHFNRFCTAHPDHQAVPMTCDLLPKVKEFTEGWHARRRETDPQGDYLLENLAMARAFNHWEELALEGIALVDTSGEVPRIRYVFDVADTGARHDSRSPFLWQLEDQHMNAVHDALEQRFGADDFMMADQLEHIASQLAMTSCFA